MVFKKRLSSIQLYYIKNSVEVHTRKGVHEEKGKYKNSVLKNILLKYFLKIIMDIKLPEYSVYLDFSEYILNDVLLMSKLPIYHKSCGRKLSKIVMNFLKSTLKCPKVHGFSKFL